jgi:hypothetical protein
MGLADQNELAPRGLISLVIYPKPAPAASAAAAARDPSILDLSGRQSAPWLSSLLVFLLAAAVTFAAEYMHEIWSGKISPPPRFLKALSPASGLGLHVEYEGERLLVTWSRTSPAVRSAVQGVLRIDDGGRHRDVLMDTTQIVSGSVLYKPDSSDVTFRLEVRGEESKPVVESIRVLDSAKPPPGEARPEKPRPTDTTAIPSQPPKAAPSSGPALQPASARTLLL